MVIKPKFYLFSPFVINFQLTFHLKMKNLKIDDKWKKGKKGVNHCLGVDQQQGIAKSILFSFLRKRRKILKRRFKSENGKKVFWPAFRCAQHPKAGENTQQLFLQKTYQNFEPVLTWSWEKKRRLMSLHCSKISKTLSLKS